MAEQQVDLTPEWPVRRSVLDAALKILSDGKPHTARNILNQLTKQGFTIPKRLVNSVLFSEGRRYVSYDRNTFTYRLRTIAPEELDEAIDSVKVVEEVSPVGPQIEATLVGRNDEYVFVSNTLPSPAFFEVETKGRTTKIVLNDSHPLYAHILTAFGLSANPDSTPDDVLADVVRCVELLLVSWARFETDQPGGPRRTRVMDNRVDWGRTARRLLEEEDDF